MKRILIHFSVVSLDSKKELTISGELKDDRIKFVDDENNTNYIIFKDQQIEYFKKGNIDMKYIFQLGKRTKGLYKAYGSQFVFEIETLSISKTSSNLCIIYELYQNSDYVNKTTISLSYQEE